MKQEKTTIHHLTKEGVGVSRIGDKPFYIPYAIDGEDILANIEYEGKKHIYGKVNTIYNPSSFRDIPKCSVYYNCGGCHLSHMTYEGQLNFKTEIVKKIYKQADLDIEVLDCVGMETPYYYRNKVQTPVGKKSNKTIAGFFKEGTHEIVAYDKCLVQDELSNSILKRVIKVMDAYKISPYNEDSKEGIVRHILIRRAEKETMLVLVTNKDSFYGRNNFVQGLKKEIPELTTIVQNVNKRATNVILGEKENILYGKGYIKDILCGIKFKISPKSFYQINKIQCEKLYSKAIELSKLSKEDIILDAYCGIGTIGLICASKVKQVYGVEIVQDAINDAISNAKFNNIDNCLFYCDDAEKFIAKNHNDFNVVFVDPPRKGCSESFLKTLVKYKTSKIVYISCNPETQARDVKYLLEHGYKCSNIYPFDMFPQTYHVETICLLTLKNQK